MSAPDAVAAPPRKPRFNRWLAAGLIVSAAVNLAFIGWGAARYIHHSRMADRPPSGQIEEQITRRMPEQAAAAFRAAIEKNRSEEHTSEPQSLMRISYTGFCLK